MKRRHFLKKTAAAAGVLAASPLMALASDESQNTSIKNVHVIFKTHLDIGFTDLAEDVIRRYFESFIPAALSLSEKCRNENPKDRFIWTTGSWLIYHYLQQASSDKKRQIEKAIQAGDIVWHGLPFTTHTELLDESLFMLGTSFSAKLDKMFGRKTIAAKMTDVPGHTRGIVGLMQKAGLAFLHIGVNPASMPPAVPPLFLWKTGNNAELIVMYDYEYGNVSILPDNQTATAICFTGDNHGPHSPEQIAEVFRDLRARFTQANVFASSLEAVANQILKIKNQLPIVTQEIGDTWIYGPGSDPRRMAQFRELSRLRKEWLASGTLEEYSPEDIAFGGKLLMVAEHTWGMDIKTHLKDWAIYERDELRTARKKSNFQLVEKSWAEKRAYITDAIGALPPEMAAQATRRIENILPQQETGNDYEVHADPAAPIETEHFTIAFDPITGAITNLKDNKTGRIWSTPKNPLALFGYQTFSKDDYNRFYDQYLSHRVDWAIADFGKTGIESTSAKSCSYQPQLNNIKLHKDKSGVKILLQMSVADAEKTGCPAQITETITLPSNAGEIDIHLSWFNKAAYRLPEAIWLSFVPPINAADGYLFDKMNHPVCPLDVVKNGNRSLHGIIKGVNYKDNTGGFQLISYDAFLVAPGKKSLLNFDNLQPDMSQGIHFCLFNNVWGTNFSMWFEDDMQFRFKLLFQQ